MSGKWITSWGMACCSGSLAAAHVGKCTTRAVVTSGITGTRLRLRLSNRYGTKSLLLGKEAPGHFLNAPTPGQHANADQHWKRRSVYPEKALLVDHDALWEKIREAR